MVCSFMVAWMGSTWADGDPARCSAGALTGGEHGISLGERLCFFSEGKATEGSEGEESSHGEGRSHFDRENYQRQEQYGIERMSPTVRQPASAKSGEGGPPNSLGMQAYIYSILPSAQASHLALNSLTAWLPAQFPPAAVKQTCILVKVNTMAGQGRRASRKWSCTPLIETCRGEMLDRG